MNFVFDVEKMAILAVKYCLGVSEKKKVGINGNVVASPLIVQLYKHVLLEGGFPEVRTSIDGLQELLFAFGTEEQLTYSSPLTEHFIKEVDGIIRIFAETNRKRFSNVPPEKIRMRTSSQKRIGELYSTRVKVGGLSIIPYPTEAFAQEAEMSLFEYEDFVTKACFLDKPDPVQEWIKLSKHQARLIKHLGKADTLHLKAEDTDLKMKVAGRTWINADGHINMPDGEIFTGPVENTAEGHIRFTHPGIFMGREVEDITLVFKKGKVIEAKAEKGQKLLEQILETDPGARRIGEIAIGTNAGVTKFTKNMLFDEKMGNCIHIALGRSIALTEGKNKSSLHWDILKDMSSGEIYADDKLFYKDGKFLI